MSDTLFLFQHLIYLAVFGGCYLWLIRRLPYRFPPLPAAAVLAAALYLHYPPVDRYLVSTLLRYILFVPLYAGWSLVFLRIHKSYALYLSVFFSVLMGIWFSGTQILFSELGIHNMLALTAVTGVCRVVSVFFIGRYGIRIEASRIFTPHQITIGLFPAAACFIANLVLFDYLNSPAVTMTASYRALLNGLVIFFGISTIFVLLNTEWYFRLSRYKLESERAQQQLNTQYQLFLAGQENDRRLRAFQHDMHNHLRTLEVLAGTPGAQNYIQELKQNIYSLEPDFATGCATLDALLTVKKADCDQKGIKLTCLIHLTQADFLSPVEISTLFGNCLDNAIEAVSDSRLSNPYIHLSGGEVNDNMVIRIENPYVHTLRPSGDDFETTKKDSELHGYGLRNIRRVVEEKGGTVTFRTDGGKFIVTWMIPLRQA